MTPSFFVSETVNFNCIKCSNSFMLLKNTDLYIYFSTSAQHWKFSFSLMFSRLHLAAGICSRTTHFILILNLKRKTSIWGQDCLHIAGVWPLMILGNIDITEDVTDVVEICPPGPIILMLLQSSSHYTISQQSLMR